MTNSIPGRPPTIGDLRACASAALMVAAATLAGLAIEPRWGDSAIDLIYLPAVLGTAVLAGRWLSLAAAAASALAYNFFFTEPRFTFRMDDPNDVLTVVVLFGVALVTSQLAASVRRQAQIAAAHAARNATIAGLARKLITCTSEAEIADVTVRELGTVFDCNAAMAAGLPQPEQLASAPEQAALSAGDLAVAAMVLDSGEPAGRGFDRAVPTEWQFRAIRSQRGVLAALGLARNDGIPAVSPERVPLLDNLLDQVALAIDRVRVEARAQAFERQREQDRVRAVLVSAIGQDLAPPVHAIGKAVSEMRRHGTADRDPLTRIATETARLDRYLANLADLGPAADETPVEAGSVRIDLFHRVVTRDGEALHLTPKEYAVLAELTKHSGRVLTHAHLLRTAWGPAQERQIDYLRVAIRGLRQKLERDPARPELILNEPAVGYRLQLPASE